MDRLTADLRYAARRLFASPGFTLAAAACIAIGIGANTAIFSLANAVLLRPLPGVSEQSRLVEIGRSQDGEGSDTFGFPVVSALEEGSRTVTVAAWTFAPLAVGGDSAAEAVMGAQVSANYFDVVGVSMQRGRGFSASEGVPGSASSVVVISDGLWGRRFQRAEDIVGRRIRLNGGAATIVGVAAPGFAGTVAALRFDAWVPTGMSAAGLESPESLEHWGNQFLFGIGRIADDVGIEAVREELSAQMAALVEAHPEALRGQGVTVNPQRGLPHDLQGGVQLFLAVLATIVGLVLLVACVNVAGMVLARSMTRHREMAIRLALGARRGRLLRQLLTESLVLFGLGGVLGVAVAKVATVLLSRFEPPVPPPFEFVIDLNLDARVLLFATIATLVSGALFGLGPALRGSRADLGGALKRDSLRGVASSRGRRVLIAAQVAMTVMLAVGSGLFLRALGVATAVPLGFDPDGVYSFTLDTDLIGLDAEAAGRVRREVRQRAAAVPGVEAASFASILPLGLPQNIGLGGLSVPGFEAADGTAFFEASVNMVAPDYFEVLAMDLARGAGFDDADTSEMPRVAVINESVAAFFWPGQSALGQQFSLGDTPYTVRGVAVDSKYQSLTEEGRFFVYLSDAQVFRAQTNLLVRVPTQDSSVLAAVHGAIGSVAPDLPIMSIVPLRDYVEVSFLPQRLAATIAAILGAAAILLAAIGIYGVTAQATTARFHEIGVRMALGAARAEVVSLVLRQGMRAPMIGLLIGLVAAAAVTRLAATLLFGISALDPVVYTAGAAALLVVAFLANWLPARQAAGINPVAALRAD